MDSQENRKEVVVQAFVLMGICVIVLFACWQINRTMSHDQDSQQQSSSTEAVPKPEEEAAAAVVDSAIGIPQSPALIKSSGSEYIYYLSTDGRRYVFPNMETFNSWYYMDDLSTVVQITDSQMASIPIGGNVVFRAGTYIVRGQGQERPELYWVGHGGSLHQITEQEAIAVYGESFRNQVRVVPDSFFVNYRLSYRFRAIMDPREEGMLFRREPGGRIYLMNMDIARPVTERGFRANHFQEQFVRLMPQVQVTGAGGPNLSQTANYEPGVNCTLLEGPQLDDGSYLAEHGPDEAGRLLQPQSSPRDRPVMPPSSD